jgi:hypothetical protein
MGQTAKELERSDGRRRGCVGCTLRAGDSEREPHMSVLWCLADDVLTRWPATGRDCWP